MRRRRRRSGGAQRGRQRPVVDGRLRRTQEAGRALASRASLSPASPPCEAYWERACLRTVTVAADRGRPLLLEISTAVGEIARTCFGVRAVLRVRTAHQPYRSPVAASLPRRAARARLQRRHRTGRASSPLRGVVVARRLTPAARGCESAGARLLVPGEADDHPGLSRVTGWALTGSATPPVSVRRRLVVRCSSQIAVAGRCVMST